MNPIYPFTEQEANDAYKEWGCNCGPTSLAFALQIGLDQVRGKIPGFEEKRYTSPTMMKAGLANLGRAFKNAGADPAAMWDEKPALVRIQWTGPWTLPGANPKWAYRQTHWIVTWVEIVTNPRVMSAAALEMGAREEAKLRVFDCNGGIRSFDSWKQEIVPLLTALYPRADGGWNPTHVWRV